MKRKSMIPLIILSLTERIANVFIKGDFWSGIHGGQENVPRIVLIEVLDVVHDGVPQECSWSYCKKMNEKIYKTCNLYAYWLSGVHTC